MHGFNPPQAPGQAPSLWDPMAGLTPYLNKARPITAAAVSKPFEMRHQDMSDLEASNKNVAENNPGLLSGLNNLAAKMRPLNLSPEANGVTPPVIPDTSHDIDKMYDPMNNRPSFSNDGERYIGNPLLDPSGGRPAAPWAKYDGTPFGTMMDWMDARGQNGQGGVVPKMVKAFRNSGGWGGNFGW